MFYEYYLVPRVALQLIRVLVVSVLVYSKCVLLNENMIKTDSIMHADKLYSQKVNICIYFQAILAYMINQVLNLEAVMPRS